MGGDCVVPANRSALERLYAKYNRRDLVAPDPLELLYRFDDPADCELAALLVSTLAYGKVAQILRSATAILDGMRSPARFLKRATRGSLRRYLAGFRHRFTRGEELAALLWGAREVIGTYGSLQACFAAGLNDEDETVAPAIEAFVMRLTARAACLREFVLPQPGKGSACKRLNLFLRWMVRHDDVDTGLWDRVPRARLIIPLDTHMHRICRTLGLTRRSQADLRTAMEITAAFRAVSPDDPVRYDFALTRLGIREGGELDSFLRDYGLPGAACHVVRGRAYRSVGNSVERRRSC